MCNLIPNLVLKSNFDKTEELNTKIIRYLANTDKPFYSYIILLYISIYSKTKINLFIYKEVIWS